MGLDSFNAAKQEPDPKDGKESITDAVMKDLRDRREAGIKKYGTELESYNGRNALVDAYQEGLDLVMYLRQCISEGKHESLELLHHVRNKVNLLRCQIPQNMLWVWDDAMQGLYELERCLE